MSEETTPTDRARAVVRGAYDLHVHVGPDVVGRIVDDVTLAQRHAEQGLAGFGLKSHYTSTAERAAVVNRTAPQGVRAIGTLTLNAAVGGLNPLAVEIAAREGARIVWLPTVDAVNEAGARDRPYPPGAKVPMWVRLQRELREAGMEAPPVPVVEDGAPVAALHDVLRVVADHQLVLATGHLHRDEIPVVVDAALAAGVRDVVVTHPEFTSQDIPIAGQVALAERGAILERCFTTPHTGKCSWGHVAEGIRATGVERNLLSTDLGQPANPPVEDGLALFADRLLERGFDEEEIRQMSVVQSRRLAGTGA